MEAVAPRAAEIQSDMGKLRPANKWAMRDLVPGLTNYLIVEGISGKTPDRWAPERQALGKFQNEILQALGTQLPTLCVRTAASNTPVPLSANVD